MKWIDSQSDFDVAMEHIAAQPAVAVDTEADSLHSYFDKVCLIQISAGGEDYVIDPLRRIDLAAFGNLLRDPNVTKILHGADYDLGGFVGRITKPRSGGLRPDLSKARQRLVYKFMGVGEK